MIHLAAAASAGDGTSHDTRLIVPVLLGIALIVLLIARLRMLPFLALILGSAVTGFLPGTPAVGPGSVLLGAAVCRRPPGPRGGRCAAPGPERRFYGV